MVLKDGPAKLDRVAIIKENPHNVWIRLALHEGRNRIIRRMCEAVAQRFPTLPPRLGRGLDPGGSSNRRLLPKYRDTLVNLVNTYSPLALLFLFR